MMVINFTAGTHSNGRGARRNGDRHAEGWRRALNGHTLSAHGKEGKTVENCPACRDLLNRMNEATK